MTDGTTTILNVTGIVVGSAILGAALYEGGKYAVNRIRFDIKSDVKTDADGKVIEHWKTWTPKKRK